MKQTVVVITGKTDNGDHIDTTVFSHMPTRREFFENAYQYEDIGEDEAEDSDYESDDFAWVYPDPDRVNDPDEPIGEGDVQVGNIFFEVEICEIVEAKRENRAEGATKRKSRVPHLNFVQGEDGDWAGVFIDGKLHHEEHSLDRVYIVGYQAVSGKKYTESFNYVRQGYMEFLESLPENFSELSEKHLSAEGEFTDEDKYNEDYDFSQDLKKGAKR